MSVVALLVGAALCVLLNRRPASERLQSVLPRAGAAPSAPRSAAAFAGPLSVFAGVATALALWSVLGVAIGLGLAFLGPRLLAHLDSGATPQPDRGVSLALALDLLAACLAGGASPVSAVEAVAAATPGSLGARLGQVGALLGVGASPAEAFAALGDEGPAGAAARTMRRALEGGTPVAAAVARVAQEARQAAAVEATKRARRAGVTIIAPVAACFLPAFVLIGVVPCLYSLGTDLVSGLS